VTEAIKTFSKTTLNLAIQPTSTSTESPQFRLAAHWTTAYTLSLCNPNGGRPDIASEYQMILDVSIYGFEMSFVFIRRGVGLRILNPQGTASKGSLFSRLNRAPLGQNPGASFGAGDLLDSAPFDILFKKVSQWNISFQRSFTKSLVADASGQFLGQVIGPLEWQINFVADWAESSGVVVVLLYYLVTSTFVADCCSITRLHQKTLFCSTTTIG
jgi:hypothetical protein